MLIVNRKKSHIYVKRIQLGISLVELMVGVAIGLLVVSVAVGALMVSRNISGTVSDATMIQQQAAYAMRVIGSQVRQAGSLRLNLDARSTGSIEYLTQVGIEKKAPAVGGGNSFFPKRDSISGTDNSISVAYLRYKEASYSTAADTSLSRNCLGGPDDASEDQRLESIFDMSGNQLRCNGNGAGAQSIANNVADFQIRYLRQDNSELGNSKMQRVVGSAVANWAQIQGVEVCLVMYGNEPIETPVGSFYVGCDGNNVDLNSLTGVRARRLHLVFRNTFQMRSQGLAASEGI